MTRSSLPIGLRPAALALSCLLALAACGGGGGGGGDGGDFTGPFIVNFETPAADSVPEAEPLALAPGVTMRSASNLFLWSNAQGWAVVEDGTCDAMFNGNQGMGSDDEGDSHTMFIDFDPAVATVEVRVAAAVGTTITLESLSTTGSVIETITVPAPSCPSPMTLVRFGIDATTNTIGGLRIQGNVPVIDDLTWYRFQ